MAPLGSIIFVALFTGARCKHPGGCTAVVLGKGATVDGGPMASQTADSTNGDFRMVYVPARDHAPGSKRPLPRGDGVHMMYPRSTDSAHSPQYGPVLNAVHESLITGHIPEVAHTYALWEGLYGIMNEHGLVMGESTCEAKTVGVGVPNGGDALFTINNLMTVALERCRTAVCAVQLMGDLAEDYGFFGEDPGIGGAGEAVTLADAEDDAWVFHVAGGVLSRTGALWVAQRVPDGHVAVVANSFVIQEVDLDDKENFRGSRHLLQDAQSAGIWDGHGTFNWQKIQSPDYNTSWESGENAYDPLRQWRIFNLAAPDCGVGPTNFLGALPFSVQVQQKASHLDLMNWLRDMYEGSEFDMTMGALAGPWGSPRRYGGGGEREIPGQIARSISVSWSIYSVIGQPGAKRPVLWYAADSAATSVFVPFFCDALKAGGDGLYAEKEFGSGSMLAFDLRDIASQPAWWAFNFVSNLMQLNYRNISQQYVYPKVQELQFYTDAAVNAAAADAEGLDERAANKLLAERGAKVQRHVAEEWWDLASMLILRYNDQSFNFPPHAPTTSVDIGLPASWLQMIGYDQHSYFPRWMRPAEEPPSLLALGDLAVAQKAAHMRAEWSQSALAAENLGSSASFGSATSMVLTAVFSAFFGALIGHAVGVRRASAVNPDDYIRVTA